MSEFRPGKPRRRRTLTSSQSAGSVPHTVAWDADQSDGTWGAGTSSSSLVIGLAGLYTVHFGMGHTSGTGAQVVNAELQLNGTRVAQQQSASATGLIGCCGSWMEELVIGDALALVLVGNALTGGKNLDTQLTWLRVARIGPVRWT